MWLSYGGLCRTSFPPPLIYPKVAENYQTELVLNLVWNALAAFFALPPKALITNLLYLVFLVLENFFTIYSPYQKKYKCQKLFQKVYLIKVTSTIISEISVSLKNCSETNLHSLHKNEEILNGKLHFLCSPSYLFEWMAILTWDYHCEKSVFIQSYSDPYFPAFGLNTERYEVSPRIQSECGKIRTRITPNTDTFHAVHCLKVYLEPSHISEMDAFAEIVHGWKLKASNYFCKRLHLKPCCLYAKRKAKLETGDSERNEEFFSYHF